MLQLHRAHVICFTTGIELHCIISAYWLEDNMEFVYKRFVGTSCLIQNKNHRYTTYTFAMSYMIATVLKFVSLVICIMKMVSLTCSLLYILWNILADFDAGS